MRTHDVVAAGSAVPTFPYATLRHLRTGARTTPLKLTCTYRYRES